MGLAASANLGNFKDSCFLALRQTARCNELARNSEFVVQRGKAWMHDD